MNRRVHLLLICCLLSGFAFAQTRQVDSRKAQLTTHLQADTGRVNQLNVMSRAASDPTVGIRLAKEARQLAERLAYRQGVAQALMNIAWHYTTVNDCKQANRYARQAYAQSVLLHDRVGEINSLTQLAYIYVALGNYVQSVDFAQQALALVEPMPDKSRKAYVNLLLGQLQAHLGNYDKARAYAQTGILLAREAHNSIELSRGLNILGEIHRMRGEWAVALRYYRRDLRHQKNHTLNKAICEGNIADVSDRLGAYSEALHYGQSVLAYCRQLKATSYIAWIEGVLSRVYLHTGRTNEAIAYASRSFRVADQGGLRKIASEAAEVLSLAYARQGKYAESYRYEQRYTALKDSLRSEEIIRQTTALQFKYDLEKQQSEIALLTKNRQIEHEESRYQRGLLYASLIGLGLLLALAVVLFLNNRNKQRVNALLADQKQFIETQLTAELAVRQQELLTTQLRAQQEELRAAQAQLRLKEEKERIARDLHDHVGAQLSVIAASASGNSADVGLNSSIGSYAREAIQSLRDTVWAIDQSSVSLGDFRTKLQQYLNRQQQLHPACTYTLDCQVLANPLLTSAQALNLFRQAQEAVHNAFKYAQASQVVAECQLVDELFTLSIRDNGVGFEPALTIDEQPRYGLRNLHRRAEELHGTCQIDTAPGHGTCVRITVPLSA